MAPAPAQDFRTAAERELLEAIDEGDALALAEAYHRLIPAAHAVARRLMGDAAQVEQILEQVFAQLWERPPTDVALGGWIRRATWSAAAERLRATGAAPASPSASGLLPDLPAPDVRFLDAAERAIDELPEDERRALLLAHDKGVPTGDQEPGAADALVRALLTLAGPETSAGDRAALHEDGCADLPELGDWCLELTDARGADVVEDAIEQRPGCAAKSRAVRRGRRRIEGLPATPDMGQRVLVRVLTAGGKLAAGLAPVAAVSAEIPAESPLMDPVAEDGPSTMAAEDEMVVAGVTGPMTVDAPVDPDAAEPAVTEGVADLDDQPPAAADPVETAGAVAASAWAADAMMDTADLPASDAGLADDAGDVAEDRAEDRAEDIVLIGEAAAEARGNVGQREMDDDAAPPADDDLPPAPGAEDAEPDAAPPDHGPWAPTPGDTAELRLSDILAEEEDPDDPFADLDADDPEPEPVGSSPYAALQDLEGGEPVPAGAPFGSGEPAVPSAGADVYVEGQDDRTAAAARGGRRNPMASLLSWLLPILGGAAVGIIIAAQVFGAPGG